MAGGNGDGTVRVLPRPLQSSDGHLVSNDLISRTLSERRGVKSDQPPTMSPPSLQP